MAGLVASGLTAALKTQAFAELQESVFYNDEVFGLFPLVEMTGGTTWNVKHHYAANSSIRTYSEGDAAPIPGTESYITANWPVAYYQGVIQITGHVRDQLRNGNPGAEFFPQIALELQNLVKGIVDKASTDMLSTGLTAPVGIQGIVDNAGTIAGLSRATYSWFQAIENAIAGASLAVTDLDICQQQVMDAENAGRPDMWLTSHKQVRLAANFGFRPTNGALGSTNPGSMTYVNGQPIDLGFNPLAMTWAGKPVIPLRDLTNSVWLLVQRDTMRIIVNRDITVDPLAKTDDSDKFMVTASYGLACTQPKFNGKVTGA